MTVAVALAAFNLVGVADEVAFVPLMVEIEGGSYPIGTVDELANTRPGHPVMPGPLLIDTFPARQSAGPLRQCGYGCHSSSWERSQLL